MRSSDYPWRLELGAGRLSMDTGGFSFRARAVPDCSHTSCLESFFGLQTTTVDTTYNTQMQILALSRYSYRDNVTTDALAFAGVLLDVSAACLALLVSMITQRHIYIVEGSSFGEHVLMRREVDPFWAWISSRSLTAGWPVLVSMPQA